MSKHKLILGVVAAAALGGAYYYTRKHGGVRKLSDELKARLSITSVKATAQLEPTSDADDKETEL